MLLMLATLVYGCFNVGTTIPDLGTPHPLPWVACEKKLDTLKLIVLMLLMLYKVVLKTNKKILLIFFFFNLVDLTL